MSSQLLQANNISHAPSVTYTGSSNVHSSGYRDSFPGLSGNKINNFAAHKTGNSDHSIVSLQGIRDLIDLSMKLGIEVNSSEWSFLTENHLTYVIEESLYIINDFFGDVDKIYLEVDGDDLFVIIKVSLDIDDATERLGKLYSQWWKSKRSSVKKEILFDLEF